MCSVEQNKVSALIELMFLWKMESLNKMQINENHLLDRMSVTKTRQLGVC